MSSSKHLKKIRSKEPEASSSNAKDVDESRDEAQDAVEVEEPKTFADLGLSEPLVKACKSLGWKAPTHIQRQAIPWGLQKRDVIGVAQTGSGKTAAFALPILESLLKEAQGLFALILAPTRELAIQIAEQIDALGGAFGVTTATIVGGVDLMTQSVALAKKPHIIVGTPGRIVDHLQNTKGFSLSKLKFLVMDEADRLLNLEFEAAIDAILEVIPKDRTSFLFSATMTSQVNKLQRASLRNPMKVETESKYQTVNTLVQHYLLMPELYKDCYLAYLLVQFQGSSTIIFASKCITGQKLALMLRSLGFEAIPLHGKLTQSKRIGALNKFKSGDRNILVATDVASRGLHIPEVDLVINYDIPISPKDYIHRVGRTARAGRSGRALNLVTQYDVEYFQKIEKHIGLQMELYPTEESTVLVLMERVAEAQRYATMEVKKENLGSNNGKKRKREGGEHSGDMDRPSAGKKKKH